MLLTSTKKPLFSEQSDKNILPWSSPLLKAVFLFVSILGRTRSMKLLFLRGGVTSNQSGLGFFTHGNVPIGAPSHLFLHKNSELNITIMNTKDVSAYLIELYLHSEEAITHDCSEQEMDAHLHSVENWWKRQKEVGEPLTSATLYLMLTHINMLKAYVYGMQIPVAQSGFSTRLAQLKGELIERFGMANDLLEDLIYSDRIEWDQDEPEMEGQS